jgi:tetratricopeptide (TPR) repeat protein
VQELFNRRNYDAALTACERFVSEFGSSSDGWVAERVAYVLLLEEISLRRLDRGAEAVAAMDGLSARFGTASDPDVRDHVVRGLIHCAQTLEGLGRSEEAVATYDALIARYRKDPDPRVGRRVSWALWNMATLLDGADRDADRESLYDQLADRSDEGVDSSLDNNIAWCLQHRAWSLSLAGNLARQVEVCDELVRRFGDAKAVAVRRRVLGALVMKATALENLGDLDAALAIYGEIVTRFGGSSEAEIREGLVGALRQKGLALGRHGRHGEAITTFDEALTLLADPGSVRLPAEASCVLLSKGIELERMGRAAEAVVVYDSAVAAYREADVGARTSAGLVWAVMALSYKISDLCHLGRSAEADTALSQLTQALGDVAPPSQGAVAPPPCANEDDLAGALAEVLATGEYWRFFDPPAPHVPHQEMAGRALALYRLTDPWVTSEESALAVQVAAGLLRDIADGYALLARTWTAEELARLPLPKKAEEHRARLIRRFGLDEWLAEHGFHGFANVPEITDDPEDDSQLIAPGSDPEAETDQFWKFFLSAVNTYGLRLALCDSPNGRQILSDVNLRHFACRQLATTRRWVRQLGPEHQLAPAAVMSLLIAQGFFLTSYTKPQSSQDVFPSRNMLHEMFDDPTFREQVEVGNATLPAWLCDPTTETD